MSQYCWRLNHTSCSEVVDLLDAFLQYLFTHFTLHFHFPTLEMYIYPIQLHDVPLDGKDKNNLDAKFHLPYHLAAPYRQVAASDKVFLLWSFPKNLHFYWIKPHLISEFRFNGTIVVWNLPNYYIDIWLFSICYINVLFQLLFPARYNFCLFRSSLYVDPWLENSLSFY